MNHLDDIADRLNRTVKIALDTGEAATIEEAERIFTGYRVQILLGPDVAYDPVLQAAALTAVNCAARTLLGGVAVIGATGDLKVRFPGSSTVEGALRVLGGQVVAESVVDCPTIVIGDAAAPALDRMAIRATFDGWSGGVTPASEKGLKQAGAFTPAGVLAGALAVSEVFQRVRSGNPMACRRCLGLDLWRPELDWRSVGDGPPLERMPASAWLVGLGNLGQAYLWTLGMLPYGDVAADLVLQDLDVLAWSNLSTSLLTSPKLLHMRKTRAMAAWAEARGFRTAIVERTFDRGFRVSSREPSVALIGVDNALARQAIEDVGFDRIIEAGLGRGTRDFLGIDLHTFPASRSARDVWREISPTDGEIAQPAYRAILEQTGDRCGTVRLAGRSVGAPFVGAVAATLVVAELIRLAVGGHRYEMIGSHLRDLDARVTVRGTPWPPFNVGSLPAFRSTRADH